VDVKNILNKAGYKTIIGRKAVLLAIKKTADDNIKLLCSGYGVFPNGQKCEGCKDCLKKQSEKR
jgi:predicted alpha/beta-hydrolase family hydrolase